MRQRKETTRKILTYRSQNNIKMDVGEIGWSSMDWIVGTSTGLLRTW
jgi:hypothetical protein